MEWAATACRITSAMIINTTPTNTLCLFALRMPRLMPCRVRSLSSRDLGDCTVVGDVSEQHRPVSDFLWVGKTGLGHEAENSALGVVFKGGHLSEGTGPGRCEHSSLALRNRACEIRRPV